MSKIVFTEEFCSPENLFPFMLTRQIQDIRIGIFTIRQKWERYLETPSYDKQEGDYKDSDSAVELDKITANDTVYLVHGNVLPTQNMAKRVKKLKPGEFLSVPGQQGFVYSISGKQIISANKIKVEKSVEYNESVKQINFPSDIVQLNEWAIQQDFELVTKRRKSKTISSTNKTTAAKSIFIEDGATVEHCFLNASKGPIYIGKNAVVMEGSMLRGPIAICEGAVVKMGTKIYGATTIGPFSTVGGEIKNSVLFGYSNKAHDGYLGDAVIGEWCNLGAGTTNSNVKNNASDVQVYTPSGLINVGLKCGVFMGDYSRTAINTSINTGTVIGVCSNVYGTGLTPKYIPSFSWGSDGIQRYHFQKALQHIQNWKGLKHKLLTETEALILKHIFDHY